MGTFTEVFLSMMTANFSFFSSSSMTLRLAVIQIFPAHLKALDFLKKKENVLRSTSFSSDTSGFREGRGGMDILVCATYLSGCHVHVTSKNGKRNMYLVDCVYVSERPFSFFLFCPTGL